MGQPVVPAVLLAGYVFTALMQRLPGPGTLSLMQTFHFLHPVHIGDTVTIVVEVIAIDAARGRVRLRAVAATRTGRKCCRARRKCCRRRRCARC